VSVDRLFVDAIPCFFKLVSIFCGCLFVTMQLNVLSLSHVCAGRKRPSVMLVNIVFMFCQSCFNSLLLLAIIARYHACKLYCLFLLYR
jgi:hypothetical protein